MEKGEANKEVVFNGEYDVIIIGAGISGLATAHHLKAMSKNKLSILILEARDRIGGRINSTTFGESKFDIGAAFIHSASKENEIFKLAKRLKLSIKKMNWTKSTYLGEDGSPPHGIIDHLRMFNRFEKIVYSPKRRKKILEEAGIEGDAPLSEVIRLYKAKAKFNHYESSMFSFLEKVELDLDYAASADHLSALHFDQHEYSNDIDYTFGGLHHYGMIISHLAEPFEIKLNQQVIEIDYEGDVKQVRSANGDRFRAKMAIVCTLPIGVLKAKTVSFNPPLPIEKTAAIEKLGVALLNVVLLEFEDVFWPSTQTFYEIAPDREYQIVYFHNLHSFTRQKVLKVYIGGNQAREMEGWEDEKITEVIINNLSRTLSISPIPPPIRVTITRWASDPFSLGSYSHIPPGCDCSAFEDLSKAVGDLYFAGEATQVVHHSTVHGGYTSGFRTAKSIISSIDL